VALATKKGDTPVDRIEVFRVPQGTLVTLRPGVWHHAPFAFECECVNVMVVLPERTYMNDCFVFIIPEEEQIEMSMD
jgi:ureidoglycolate lyase